MGEAAPAVVVLSPEQVEALVDRAVEKALASRRPASADEPEVMTRDQAAKLLQVHPSVLVRYVQREGLPASKIGPEWRFRRTEILEWMRGRVGAKAKRLRSVKGSG